MAITGKRQLHALHSPKPEVSSDWRKEEPPLCASLGDTSFENPDPWAEAAPTQSKPERAGAGRCAALLFLLLKYLTENCLTDITLGPRSGIGQGPQLPGAAGFPGETRHTVNRKGLF